MAKMRKSYSQRAGLLFPVGRLRRVLREKIINKRTELKSSIMVAAVIQYLVKEIIDVAGMAAQRDNRKVIIPRHLELACFSDDDLKILLKDIIIPEGGVLPDKI